MIYALAMGCMSALLPECNSFNWLSTYYDEPAKQSCVCLHMFGVKKETVQWALRNKGTTPNTKYFQWIGMDTVEPCLFPLRRKR